MEEKEQKYLRFPLTYRIEHLVVLTSFTTLAITGLVQKYATYRLAQMIIGGLGGIEVIRVIHRIAAIMLMLETVYHIGAAFYRLYVERRRPSMLPGLDDAKNAAQAFQYNLGMRKDRPQQGRFTFEEKAEYWAMVWGTIVMGITGFVLWNPIAATSVLPGEFIPAALEVHGGEALLAVLAIIVWHMYHVHIRHFNRSMFTGHLTEEEMLEEHPIELADIKAGLAQRPVDPQKKERRRRIFIPLYGVISVLLLAGIYWFATFEQTAIATVPEPESVVVYSPFTPTPLPLPEPTATPAAPAVGGTAAASWDGGIAALFASKCASCHGESTQLGDINLSSYPSALAGDAVVPGDPEASRIIEVQSAGSHPGQFTDDELQVVSDWISAGAPE